MFTGIVERTGKILEQNGGRLVVDAGAGFDVAVGDSVSVSGVCLTVKEPAPSGRLVFDVSTETLARTRFGQLAIGELVNLERACRASDRLGGHIVSGHVDGLGQVTVVQKDSGGWLVQVDLSRDLGRYVVAKGSITLDGVSLTVNEMKDHASETLISCMLIPATIDVTTLCNLKVSSKIHVEVDQLAKVVERLLAHRGEKG